MFYRRGSLVSVIGFAFEDKTNSVPIDLKPGHIPVLGSLSFSKLRKGKPNRTKLKTLGLEFYLYQSISLSLSKQSAAWSSG